MTAVRGKTLFILTLVLAYWLACERGNGPSAPEIQEKGLRGRVLDQQSRAIPGVDVHYLFIDSAAGVFPVVRRILIPFYIEKDQPVTLTVYNMFRQPVDVLIDAEPYLIGFYEIIYDGTGLPNGVYSYRMEKEIPLSDSFYYLTLDLYKPNGALPLTSSDSRGYFHVDYETMGIGDSFPYLADQPLQIMDSVNIVLIKEGYSIATVPVKLDTSSRTDITIQLNAN